MARGSVSFKLPETRGTCCPATCAPYRARVLRFAVAPQARVLDGLCDGDKCSRAPVDDELMALIQLHNTTRATKTPRNSDEFTPTSFAAEQLTLTDWDPLEISPAMHLRGSIAKRAIASS